MTTTLLSCACGGTLEALIALLLTGAFPAFFAAVRARMRRR